jgi:hypothetical protein
VPEAPARDSAETAPGSTETDAAPAAATTEPGPDPVAPAPVSDERAADRAEPVTGSAGAAPGAGGTAPGATEATSGTDVSATGPAVAADLAGTATDPHAVDPYAIGPDSHERAPDEHPRVTDKGLPKRTPKISAPVAAPRPRVGGVDADALRRRLGGFHRGAVEGRRDVEAEIADRTAETPAPDGRPTSAPVPATHASAGHAPTAHKLDAQDVEASGGTAEEASS